MQEHLNKIVDGLLNQGPYVALLVGILYANYKQWWVWGHQLEAMKRDKEAWQNVALHEGQVSSKSVQVSERLLDATARKE